MSFDDKSLMPGERIRAIAAQIEADGRVRVEDAAARFGVSTETVRRDLKQIASTGRAKLVRGGAILDGPPAAATSAGVLPPVDQRAFANEAEKAAIGRAAAEFVKDGQTVLLDGGTTTVAVARALRGLRNLTIMTNNLALAHEIARNAGWRVHVVGGELSPASMSLVGLGAIRGLQHSAVDVAFLGAAGVSAQHGFTSPDPFESELKRSMMAIARRVIVVADHTKLSASGFASFAMPQDIHLFITSDGADPQALAALRTAGADLLIAGQETIHD